MGECVLVSVHMCLGVGVGGLMGACSCLCLGLLQFLFGMASLWNVNPS